MRALVTLLLVFFTAAPRAAVTVQDARGQELRFDAPVQRIVSLAPHLTELLFAAGAGPRVMGTPAYSDFPEQARTIPVIGDSAALDVERIVALRPDLVVAWQSGNPPRAVAKLERLGLRVLVMEPHGLDSIPEDIEALGRIAGSKAVAAGAATRFRAEVAALRGQYRGRRRLPVFYEVWHAPLMTINGRQMISEVLALCGGDNIFAAMDNLVPTVSLEAVLAANPAAIVTASDPPAAEALANWQRWPKMRAVRNGNLLAIPADDISRPTPRLLSGARRLCRQLDEVRQRTVAAQ